MTFESNVAAIEALVAATRDHDEAAFGAAYADDAVVRQSGVPESLGGVLRGEMTSSRTFGARIRPRSMSASCLETQLTCAWSANFRG